MKHFAACAMVVVFVALSTQGFSQAPTKAKNFSSYPDHISCKEVVFSSLFLTTEGQQVTVNFPSGLTFKGTVSSNVQKYKNLQTVVVKSTSGDGETLSISKITNEDNNITYAGRILNQKYFDAYELRQVDAANYQLTKVETDKVIQSCHQ